MFPAISCRTPANLCFVALGWLGYFAVHSALASLAAKGWWSAKTDIDQSGRERQQCRGLLPIRCEDRANNKLMVSEVKQHSHLKFLSFGAGQKRTASAARAEIVAIPLPNLQGALRSKASCSGGA